MDNRFTVYDLGIVSFNLLTEAISISVNVWHNFHCKHVQLFCGFVINLSLVGMFNICGSWSIILPPQKLIRVSSSAATEAKTTWYWTMCQAQYFIPVTDTRCALIDIYGGKVTKWLGDKSIKVKPWLMCETKVRCGEVLPFIHHYTLKKIN